MTDDAKNQKRLRLYGKPATQEEIAKELARLLLGDIAHDIKPKTKTEARQAIGFSSRDSFYRYFKLAQELKFFEVDADGNVILPKKSTETIFEEFSEDNPIVNHPLITDWVYNMRHRKAGGSEIQQWKARLRHFTTMLNTLKENPEAFLISLENSDRLAQNFRDLYAQGKAKTNYNSRTLQFINQGRIDRLNLDKVAYTYSQAYRDFMNFHKLPYPKNWGGISSQKVVGHGNYADVKLSDADFDFCDKWIKSRFGKNSMEYLLFWVGVESCARNEALFNMALNWNVIENSITGDKAYILEAYESKTKQKKGGKWKKYITRKETQEVLEWAKSQGHKFLWSGFKNKFASNQHHSKWLKELYTELGKAEVHKSHPEESFGYFITHTIHTFRHIGAHYWLRKTKYNYGIVAKVGGWWTTKELEDSYGETPEEVILEGILGAGKIVSVVTGLDENE